MLKNININGTNEKYDKHGRNGKNDKNGNSGSGSEGSVDEGEGGEGKEGKEGRKGRESGRGRVEKEEREEEIRDPQGFIGRDRRVLRGGSWYSYPRLCRSAYRFRIAPVDRLGNIGLRVCLLLD